MVQVFNQVEQAERSNLTTTDTHSSPLHEQAHALMRDGHAKNGATHRAEPGQIDFSAHNIYANCDGSIGKGPSMTRGERDFKPDMSYSGPQGREFLKKMQDQREKPIELNSDGKYEVKPGDTLSTLAERALRDGDHKPSQKDIQNKVKELEMLNGDQLGNRHLLKPGMKLKLNPGADDVCRPQSGAGNAPDEDMEGPSYGAGTGSGDASTSPDLPGAGNGESSTQRELPGAGNAYGDTMDGLVGSAAITSDGVITDTWSTFEGQTLVTENPPEVGPCRPTLPADTRLQTPLRDSVRGSLGSTVGGFLGGLLDTSLQGF